MALQRLPEKCQPARGSGAALRCQGHPRVRVPHGLLSRPQPLSSLFEEASGVRSLLQIYLDRNIVVCTHCQRLLRTMISVVLKQDVKYGLGWLRFGTAPLR